MRIQTLATWLALAFSTLSHAQAVTPAPSSLTLYGTIDQYLNYMKSSSGASIRSLNDGATLRSRVGLRGVEDLGGGMAVRFNLEHGLAADTGAQADGSRFFDRQAWVGMSSPWGDVRVGRQNSAVFTRGDQIDHTTRALGSVVNAFGVPARYDNDIAWLSPRLQGLQLELHYAPGEGSGGPSAQAIWQAAVDYTTGPWRLGYAGLSAASADGTAYDRRVNYQTLYANVDHGQGKVYAAVVQSNNSTGTEATSANASGILGYTGALVAGTNADVNRSYRILQVSSDYRITPSWRVGALWGKVMDRSHTQHGATGYAVSSFYDVSKRTSLMLSWDSLSNEDNAGFRPAGSGAVSPNFTQGDVNGQRIQGLHAGVLHRF